MTLYPGETWAVDEIGRVMGGQPVLAMPDSALYGPLVGFGEWDWLRATPRRSRRRLAGAGYLSSYGERPDIVADWIVDRVADVEHGDALGWFTRKALLAIDQRRREAHYLRHHRRAQTMGFASWYEYVRAIAHEHGHGSYHHMAQDRGWRPLPQ